MHHVASLIPRYRLLHEYVQCCHRPRVLVQDRGRRSARRKNESPARPAPSPLPAPRIPSPVPRPKDAKHTARMNKAVATVPPHVTTTRAPLHSRGTVPLHVATIRPLSGTIPSTLRLPAPVHSRGTVPLHVTTTRPCLLSTAAAAARTALPDRPWSRATVVGAARAAAQTRPRTCSPANRRARRRRPRRRRRRRARRRSCSRTGPGARQ